TPSVLDNDELNGGPIDPSEVTLTPGTAVDEDGHPVTGIVMNPDGTVTISPEAPSGTYKYPYTICEILNPDNCSTAMVTVVVETAVQPPTTIPAERVASPETPVSIPVGEVVTPGTDGSPTVTFPNTPDGFEVTIDGTGNIIITAGPNAPAGVPVEIPFEVEDEHGNKVPGVITITVEFGLEADDDAVEVQSGGSATISVLSNDVAGSSPIAPTSIRIVSQPTNGTVTVNPDGTITYNSKLGFTGTDTYTYEVADENGYLS